jgi:hypothetical protein
MGKALILSVVVMTFAIPIFFSRDARAKRGLRRTVVAFGLFCAVYVLVLLFVLPRF